MKNEDWEQVYKTDAIYLSEKYYREIIQWEQKPAKIKFYEHTNREICTDIKKGCKYGHSVPNKIPKKS